MIPTYTVKKISINIFTFSPKPYLPPSKAYDPPSPPSAKDLGPPPPGYGRYADFDRGPPGGPPGGSLNPTGPPRRNLDEVLCFKVCRYSHTCFCNSEFFINSSAGKRGIMPTIVGTVMFQVIEGEVKESSATVNKWMNATCLHVMSRNQSFANSNLIYSFELLM